MVLRHARDRLGGRAYFVHVADEDQLAAAAAAKTRILDEIKPGFSQYILDEVPAAGF
jgi:hypothetical protein